VAVLRTEVARRVSIDVLSVYVSVVLDECLDDAEVTSQASDVQGSSKRVCSRINLSAKFDQDFDRRRVALAGCQVERSETIRVGAVNDFEELVGFLELLLGVPKDLVDFVGVALIYLGPVVHLHVLDVLLTLALLRRLLRDVRGSRRPVALHGLVQLVASLGRTDGVFGHFFCIHVILGVAPTVAELISLFIVVVIHVNFQILRSRGLLTSFRVLLWLASLCSCFRNSRSRPAEVSRAHLLAQLVVTAAHPLEVILGGGVLGLGTVRVGGLVHLVCAAHTGIGGLGRVSRLCKIVLRSGGGHHVPRLLSSGCPSWALLNSGLPLREQLLLVSSPSPLSCSLVVAWTSSWAIGLGLHIVRYLV